MSPLRLRMIEDMAIRNFVPKTQQDYIRAVRNFSTFLGVLPDGASLEDVRRYQLHMATSGTSATGIIHGLTALRFRFTVTLRRPDFKLAVRIAG